MVMIVGIRDIEKYAVRYIVLPSTMHDVAIYIILHAWVLL